jgi:dipeptidyl aminopeptidase/acylaminoacyl peptidase
MKSKGKILLVLLCFFLISSCTKKEDVIFENGDLELSGTLYLPEGDGPFPAVVFVHGSGVETRENSSYSAKWLASIGYAALIYDKRGTGKSGGDEKEVNSFSLENLSNDVLAAVNYLATNKKVNKSKIGVHAVSQGGWVAPFAASKTNLISFMIIKSASVSTVGEDRIFERSARLTNEKFSKLEIAEAQEMQIVEAKTVLGKEAPDEFTLLFNKNKDKNWFPRVYGSYTSPFAESLVEYRKWYSTVVDFDPVVYLKKVDVPIFWMFGDVALDNLGPIAKSIDTLEKLKKAGKHYTILSYKGEDHNINEKKYELDLYKWLKEINDYSSFKFKKH